MKSNNHIYIDILQAKRNLRDFVKRHNDDYNNGKIHVKVKNQYLGTMNKLIEFYTAQVIKNVDKLNPLGMPGFLTTRTSMAKELNVTPRTVQNHINRLIDAGFLVEKQIKAPGLELYIAPEIIFHRQPAYGLQYPILPPKNAQLSTINNPETGSYIKNKYDVDGGKLSEAVTEKECGVASQPDGLKAEQEHEQEPQKAKPLESDLQGKAPEPFSKKQEQFPRAGGGSDPNLVKLVHDFISFTMKQLYPHYCYTAHEMGLLFNLIKFCVFKDFKSQLTTTEWSQYYLELIERVHFVRKWTDDHPDFILPSPLVYFSEGCKVNFHRTGDWLINHRHRKILSEVKREINLTRKKRGKHKDKSMLQLFVTHQKRLARYGDEKLMFKFNNMAQKAYQA